jgi:hypothetical protein
LPQYVGFGTVWRGWALAFQGQGEAGMTQMHQGLAAILATGFTLARPRCLRLLAEAALHTGQVDQGLHWLAETLGALEEGGPGDGLAEAYRLQGALLLHQDTPDESQAGIVSKPVQKLVGKLTLFQGIPQVLSYRKITLLTSV